MFFLPPSPPPPVFCLRWNANSREAPEHKGPFFSLSPPTSDLFNFVERGGDRWYYVVGTVLQRITCGVALLMDARSCGGRRGPPPASPSCSPDQPLVDAVVPLECPSLRGSWCIPASLNQVVARSPVWFSIGFSPTCDFRRRSLFTFRSKLVQISLALFHKSLIELWCNLRQG
jgi:hypothetical protein